MILDAINRALNANEGQGTSNERALARGYIVFGGEREREREGADTNAICDGLTNWVKPYSDGAGWVIVAANNRSSARERSSRIIIRLSVIFPREGAIICALWWSLLRSCRYTAFANFLVVTSWLDSSRNRFVIILLWLVNLFIICIHVFRYLKISELIRIDTPCEVNLVCIIMNSSYYNFYHFCVVRNF